MYANTPDVYAMLGGTKVSTNHRYHAIADSRAVGEMHG
jgi:hypothetical protein